MQHLKQTFLGDAFWLIFAVFLICFWEGESIESDHEYPSLMITSLLLKAIKMINIIIEFDKKYIFNVESYI